VLAGLGLIPARLPGNQRNFMLFAGLKGAVPILLGSFLLAARRRDLLLRPLARQGSRRRSRIAAAVSRTAVQRQKTANPCHGDSTWSGCGCAWPISWPASDGR
jgi:hypothetical protein